MLLPLVKTLEKTQPEVKHKLWMLAVSLNIGVQNAIKVLLNSVYKVKPYIRPLKKRGGGRSVLKIMAKMFLLSTL